MSNAFKARRASAAQFTPDSLSSDPDADGDGEVPAESITGGATDRAASLLIRFGRELSERIFGRLAGDMNTNSTASAVDAELYRMREFITSTANKTTCRANTTSRVA
jgi:hypothetical protein